MKIAFYSGEMGKKYASYIIELLKGDAPQHQYSHHEEEADPDLWHCMMPHSSLFFMQRASRSVVNVSDLSFVTHPEIFTLSERLFLLPLYRYHCRHAARLIANSSLAKRRLVESLGLEESAVEICSPIGSLKFDDTPSSEEVLALRAKLELPETYILVVGEMDTMHGHTTILHSILSLPYKCSVVIYGRRTTHADVLLQAVRDADASERVQFIYELAAEELTALYRMAMVMLYFPTFESSISPIVLALKQHVAMILSDTPLNREAALSAAIYVEPYDEQALISALKLVIYNESFRGQLIAQCWAESRRYSQESLAEQLARIYESV